MHEQAFVVGYAPTQLQTSGAPVPFAGVSRSKGIGDAVSLAFDAQGNLWVASLGDTIVRFTPDQLTALATPTPGVILKMPTLTGPSALAFDNSGALWVAGYDSHKLLKFTSNQLTSTGSPTPAVSVSNNVNTIYLTNSLVFSPSATNLPTP